MLKKWSILLAFIIGSVAAHSQSNAGDSTIIPVAEVSLIDTSIDYDELFRDFDAFLDSILTPRSYFLSSLSVGKGYYNFANKSNYTVTTSKKLNYSPTLGYYHKGGLGLTAIGYIVDDGKNMNFYQS
ncbi:MAG TPA: hypothetical protein PKZ90_09495, partial [Chitinophagaceae bacterium]|nr:hypothetical protein [Chitinophagaceae bacterium]